MKLTLKHSHSLMCLLTCTAEALFSDDLDKHITMQLQQLKYHKVRCTLMARSSKLAKWQQAHVVIEIYY